MQVDRPLPAARGSETGFLNPTPAVGAAVAAEAAVAMPLRRIEFHLARRPQSLIPISGGGGFHLETLNPCTGNQQTIAGQSGKPVVASAIGWSSGKITEQVMASAIGRSPGSAGAADPELCFQITFRRIGAGLENLGNTCFLNSVLQCLTYTEPFAAYLQSGKHSSSCRNAGFCALCALQNHVKNALQSSGKILRPFQLVNNLRCISRNFRSYRQEDAHEYMVNLLESMHKCSLPSGVASESPSAYEKSLVHKIFGGRLRSQVKCTQCLHCSDKYDPFLDLSLEIIHASSVVKALEHFTGTEKLDGGTKQYQCQRCREKVVAEKRLTIDKAPHVLTVHLKRFSAYSLGQKIDKRVDFGRTLDLKPFASDPRSPNLQYSLYGVLVHAGWSTQSGHYYCFVRTSTGMWHSLDDNQVQQVSEKTVLGQKAYMLFYVRERGSSVKGSVSESRNGANQSGSQKSQSTSFLNSASHVDILHKKIQQSILPTSLKSNRSFPFSKAVPCLDSGKGEFGASNVRDEGPKAMDGLASNRLSATFAEASQLAGDLATETPSDPSSKEEQKAEACKSLKHSNCAMVKSSLDDALEPPTKKVKAISERNDAYEPATKKVKAISQKKNSKQKRRIRPDENPIFLGRKHLLMSSLYPRKKKKCKMAGKQKIIEKEMGAHVVDVAGDQETSTSQAATGTSSNHDESRKKKRKLNRRTEKNMKDQHEGHPQATESITNAHLKPEKVETMNTVAEKRPNPDPNLVPNGSIPSNPQFSVEPDTKRKEQRHNDLIAILTRGIAELSDDRWDDVNIPDADDRQQLEKSAKRGIGYVLDEWDEEYDRGRLKKRKNPKRGFGGSNPFQEAANVQCRTGSSFLNR